MWCGIIKSNNVRMVENMNEKEFLIKQQKESIQRLASVRRTWFLWIWLGYSGFIFWLFLNLTEISGWGWLTTAIISLILGIICYGVNALIWSNCCRDINSALNYVEYIEKRMKQSDSQDNQTPEKEEQALPEKYLKRGYDELQLEHIKEALHTYRLTEDDIDYFLEIKDEPHLLLPYGINLEFEIEDYKEEIAREKAVEETLKSINNYKTNETANSLIKEESEKDDD